MPMLDGDDRVVGTSGYLMWEDKDAENPEEIEIPITLWSVRSQKSFQDTTSSEMYDEDTKLIYPRQAQVSVITEGEIAGRFRLSTTPTTFIAAMYSGDATPLLTLYFTKNREFGHGYFSISNFSVEAPYDGVANFTCQVMGYGKFHPNLEEYIPTGRPVPLPDR